MFIFWIIGHEKTHKYPLHRAFTRFFSMFFIDMCILKGEKKIHVDPNE